MEKFKFTKRILFLGVPDMAYIGLDTLYYSGVNIVGVVGPRTTHTTYQAFRNFVNMRKLNFIEYNTIQDDEFISRIKDMNIDLGVVCSFNEKIPQKLLDVIKGGILNIHPSSLPKYRGGNPYSRVIMNGETESAVTLHFMSAEFDTGDIVYQEPFPIDKNETMGTIFNKTNAIGCKMLLRAVIEFEQTGTLPRIPQPVGDFIKAPNVKESEKYIDYNKTATEIERKVRALNPYITANTVYNNAMVLVHKVSVSSLPNVEQFANGEICKIENDKIYIKTAEGCITPEVIQFAGYFIGDCSDFIRVVRPKVGDKFQNGFT
ncbi:MAG: methionyl-tRNA formyltransferase [Cyanobacteria bacterium RUI128]|nr:methionyl-tRNA formyltransferase [Cyanobacteria bacterium RUI128]